MTERSEKEGGCLPYIIAIALSVYILIDCKADKALAERVQTLESKPCLLFGAHTKHKE